MAVYSLESSQDSCYEGTTVLINKLNIRNQNILNNAEAAIVTARTIDVIENVKFKNADFEFYKALHGKIFGDLYDWAGNLRSINISKKGSFFCKAEDIEEIGVLKFKYLKANNYFCELSLEKFVESVADFYNEFNYLHPFREGNGRTLRLFITMLAKNAGYDIDFEKCDSDILMIATIKAFYGDLFLLRDVFKNITESSDT